MKQWFIASFLFIPSIGLAGTDMVSFKDPGIEKPYRVVVVSVNANMKDKKESEDKAVKELSKKSSTKFISHAVLMPPLREYSSEEIANILMANKVEAVLFAEVIDAQTTKHSLSIPQYQTTSEYVGDQYVNLTTPSGSTNIDYTTSQWKTKIQLFDIGKAKTVWVAEAVTDGFTEQGMRNNVIKKPVRESLKANLFENKKK